MANPEMEKLMHPIKKIALDTPAYVEENLETGSGFPGIKAKFALHPLVSPNDQDILRRRVEAVLQNVSQKMEAELRDQGVTRAQHWPVGISRSDMRNDTHPTAGPYKTFGIDVSAGCIFHGDSPNAEKTRYDAATRQIALGIIKRHFRTARTGVESIVKRLNAQYAKIPV